MTIHIHQPVAGISKQCRRSIPIQMCVINSINSRFSKLAAVLKIIYKYLTFYYLLFVQVQLPLNCKTHEKIKAEFYDFSPTDFYKIAQNSNLSKIVAFDKFP